MNEFTAKKFYHIMNKIMEERMRLPFYMDSVEDIALFCAAFGLSTDDLADYLLEDEEVYS